MATGRCVLEIALPLQCEVPLASGAQTSRPACRPCSPGHRTRRVPFGKGWAPRVQGDLWAPTAAGREPGPPRSRRTSPRSRQSSPVRAWSRSAGCRLVSWPGCAPERLRAPSAGAGRGGSSRSRRRRLAATRDSCSEWRRCAEPGAQSFPRSLRPRAFIAVPARARDVSALLAHPHLSQPGTGASRGSEEQPPASPGAPRTRTLGLCGDPGGGVC